MNIQKAFFQPADLSKQIFVFPMKQRVVFPATIIPFRLGSPLRSYVDIIKMQHGGVFGLINSSYLNTTKIGTLVKIKQIQLSESEDEMILELRAVGRFRIKDVVVNKNPLIVTFDFLETIKENDINIRAWRQMLWETFDRYARLINFNFVKKDHCAVSDEVDVIAAHLNIPVEKKQDILETLSLEERIEKIINILELEIKKEEVKRKAVQNVSNDLKGQTDRKILELLYQDIGKQLGKGTKNDGNSIITDYQNKLDAIDLPEKAREEAEKELDRLSRMASGSSEAEVVRTYLDWITSLPWGVCTDDNLDIVKARKILHEDHYGLTMIKEVIIENLAVKALNSNAHGAILCFVGPPGVGKTSMGKSIARALGREFYRLSLGGVRDEAEIRGHRRTYIGALPGNIIQGLQRVGTSNPVFMLDEIDKLGSDHRGDPSSALLEALDPEQNFSFGDHYLGVTYDLSKVMFITTANDLYSIPGPLLDRMEVIQLPGYTQEEKMKIAERHLLPRQIIAKGLEGVDIQFSKGALAHIISDYTSEAGVRNLEKRISKICRRIAVEILEGGSEHFKINKKDIYKYLGKGCPHDERIKDLLPGVIPGLAWTEVGGELLYVETLAIEGGDSLLSTTGTLGDVIQESASLAYNFVRGHMKQLNIDKEDFFNNHEIHIHLPDGATPKDGPSAGITMLTALVSIARNKPLRDDIAMTGEITLRGDITVVGGIKEKVLAAYRKGMKCVILPKANKVDIEELLKEHKDLESNMEFKFFDNMTDAVNFALK